MQFVLAVDFAPLAVRRTAFQQVGGLDEGLGEAGECGIWCVALSGPSCTLDLFYVLCSIKCSALEHTLRMSYIICA